MKTDKGEVRQPGGLSDRGEPYQGVPRRTQSCKKCTNDNRASEKKRQTLRLAGAVYALDSLGVGHAAISPKLRPRVSRGWPAGRLFHFLGCARGATSKISLSAESDSGALPLRTLPAF